MSFKKYRAVSPDKVLGKMKGDTEFARLAHVNDLIDQIDENSARLENSIQLVGPSENGATLTSPTIICKGPSYSFPPSNDSFLPCFSFDSYLIKGLQIYYGSSLVSIYLGTLKIIPQPGFPIIPMPFPEKLTGMVMASEELLEPTYDFITTPLANGAKMWDIDAGAYNILDGVQVSFYAYGDNPDPVTGEVNFAMFLEAYGSVPTVDLATSAISYQIELNLPTKFLKEVSIWID